MRRRATASLALAMFLACSPHPIDSDASLDAMGADASGVRDDAMSVPTDDDAWDVGAHAPLPLVPMNGGAVLAHPALVLVSFADDSEAAAHEADARWLVSSNWLRTVGSDYGVGPGSVAGVVIRPGNAPASATDDDIQQMLAAGIADGSIPHPTGNDTVYAVFYPQHTMLTHPRSGTATIETSCRDFGAYHSMAHRDGVDFAYLVVAGCSNLLPLTAAQHAQYFLSHELIEAATDPDPFTAPAFDLLPSTTSLPSPWIVLVGGEVADLCSYQPEWITESGFIATRVWSNTAAMAGRDNPCVPEDPTRAYFNMSATPSTLTLHAGEEGIVTLQGFSSRSVAPWTVSSDNHGSFTPVLRVRRGQLANGQSTELGITVPAGTAVGSDTVLLVIADGGNAGSFVWPVLVVVQ